MNIKAMADWAKWKYEVGKIIIDILEHRDALGLMEFTFSGDIRDRLPSLENIFPDNSRIEESTLSTLQELRDMGQIEFVEKGMYRLVDNQFLSLHLKHRRATKQLEKYRDKISKIKEVLSDNTDDDEHQG